MLIEKQRMHFRLNYPEAYRPTFILDQDTFEVENISQYGVKVIISTDLGFMLQDSIFAIIAFPEGREFDLDGHIVRIEDNCICLHLDSPLPSSVIKSEALNVMYKYPGQLN